MRWEKVGADDKATANDLVGCRRAARDETMRDFPLYFPWYHPWAYPVGRSVFWQRSEFDRFYAEDRLTAFCMRTKGYALVPVPQAPQTQAPQRPSSDPEVHEPAAK